MKGTDLRVGLNAILAEHVYLAAAATGAALGGRQPEFEGAAAALDQNSVALSQAIGSVYGPDAEAATPLISARSSTRPIPTSRRTWSRDWSRPTS